MNQELPEQIEDLLEAYLDDRLEDVERARVEALIRDNDQLQRQIELQERIDASVRRLYDPPAVPAAVATPTPASSLNRLVALAVAAAVVMLVGGGAWWYWVVHIPAIPSNRLPEIEPRRTFAQVYADATKQDFAPGWVCKDEKEFALAFYYQLGTGMRLAEPPAGVEPLGLTVAHTLSPRSLHLSARVHGRGVLLFVDRSENDSVDRIDPNCGLHLHIRKLRHLTLHELSPFDQPYLLDLLNEREVPEEWRQDPYRVPDSD